MVRLSDDGLGNLAVEPLEGILVASAEFKASAPEHSDCVLISDLHDRDRFVSDGGHVGSFSRDASYRDASWAGTYDPS
jgi:hypothetical protein